MPKIISREKDASRVNVSAENNFSVLVPGYVGNVFSKELAENIKIGLDVYELRSVSDFEKYIGKRAAVDQVARNTRPIEREVEDGEPELTGLDKYYGPVTRKDFDSFDFNIYEITELASDSEELKLGQYGPELWSCEENNKIYKLTQVLDDPIFEARTVEVTEKKYIKVQEKYLGQRRLEGVHIGNQIAYELLRLGYTVLFKVLNDATQNSIEEMIAESFWDQFKDRSIYNFRYVLSGLRGEYADPAVMNNISKIATFNYDEAADSETQNLLKNVDLVGATHGRGDCIALVDINDSELASATSDLDLAKKIIISANELTSADKYTGIFGPSVNYAMLDNEVEDFGGNKTFPASFHYLACAANTFTKFPEWYAVAGYTKGQSVRTVESTAAAIGERVINTVAPRAKITIDELTVTKSVNLVLKERNNYFLWGNRTAHPLGEELVFSHFLNIRQLCTSIKKQLYTACRKFTFDPNSDLLWVNFVNAIRPTLEAMRADYGINGYKIIKKTDNTKALLKAVIRIIPIEAVEDFDITISLEESLAGVVANVSE